MYGLGSNKESNGKRSDSTRGSIAKRSIIELGIEKEELSKGVSMSVSLIKKSASPYGKSYKGLAIDGCMAKIKERTPEILMKLLRRAIANETITNVENSDEYNRGTRNGGTRCLIIEI